MITESCEQDHLIAQVQAVVSATNELHCGVQKIEKAVYKVNSTTILRCHFLFIHRV